MSSSLVVQFLASESPGDQGGPPSEVWGIGALVILIGLLLLTWAFGRGRPHA
jgi:hypothetical protein